MDLLLAIDMNRKALLRIVAGLVVQLGLMPGQDFPQAVTRRVHGVIFHVLRPVESAVRRLIVMQAHGMTAPEPGARTKPVGPIIGGKGRGSAPAFPLFDPRINPDAKPRRAPGRGPCVRFLDGLDGPVATRHEPKPDDTVPALRLCQRIVAAQTALNDLPKQARRLMRALARPRCKWKRVMRYARPPGHRNGGKREIDEILAHCQIFALWVTEAPDTG